MGEEWVEIAALWKPRREGSRLICKGSVVEGLKEGEKVLLMRNDYATEKNRQPQFRLMVVRENPNVPFEEDICLHCGEKMDPLEIENGDSYHSKCHDQMRQEWEGAKEEEARLNPHGMG
jgi:hypothetical protein